MHYAIGLPKDIEHLPDGTSRWRHLNIEGAESFTVVFDPEPSMKIRSVLGLFAVD